MTTNYPTLDYLEDLPVAFFKLATPLTFEKSISNNLGADNSAFYTNDPVDKYSIFSFYGKEGATYDLAAVSFYTPDMIVITDSLGNVIDIVTSDENTLESTQILLGFVAPYSGRYYLAVTFDLSISDLDKSGTLLINEDIDTIMKRNYSPTGSVLISGLNSQNQTLVASNTLADADGVGAINYQWLSNGTMITNATQSKYTLTQVDVGKKITVKASYIDAWGTTESVESSATANIANVNDLPTGSVNITGSPTQNQTLVASHTLADADGVGAISYQWLSNGAVITNATQSIYTLTQADVGKKITVKASYIDGFGTNENVNSLATATIVGLNNSPTGSVNIAGIATKGQILTVSNNIADADGLGVISYQWLSNGAVITNATQSTYTLTQADVGKKITVKASYIDALGTNENIESSATANIANVNDLPTGSVTIAGIAIKGQILTASNNIADANGLGAISYQWLSNGAVITNATQSTYTLTQADVGKKITVKASYIDALGTAEILSSASTANINNLNDPPTGTVKIIGSAVKGQILTTSNNIADADGLGAINYQWLSNGAVIPNATQPSYKLTQDDTGHNVSVKVSYIDLLNISESVTSSNVLVATNTLPTGTLTIKGVATWGTKLSISNNIKDIDGLGKLSYTWQNDAGELSTSPNYTLTENDVDTKVWVTASYIDKKGNLEEIDSNEINVTISTTSSAVNDKLTGSEKIDKLFGLAGDDTLIGGAGSDKLTGGKGADTFSFSNSDFFTENSNGESVFNKSVDSITDFNLKEFDVLDFGNLGELSFYPTLNAAQEDMASLFYVKGSGKIYLNINDSIDGFTPAVIIMISGKTLINTDMTDWNYPLA